MKVMSILGSPRREGNTAKAIGLVEDELRAQGHEVERVNIVDRDIRGCAECYKCQQVTEAPGCALADDAPALFGKMIAADAVLMATPVFCWGPTAQLKALLDRCFCLSTGYGTDQYRSLVDGKRVGFVITCGGPIEGNAELLMKANENMMEFLKCRSVGQLVLPGCTTPEAMGDDVSEKARRFAREVARA